MFLNAFCDEINNYLLIILSFLNLNCLLSSFILLRVLLIVSWEFLSFLICSHRSVKGVRFLVSELTLLSFGGNFWLCLKCGLIIVFKGWPRNFVLQASTNFTHSFGFAFLISFFKCYFVPSEVFNVLIFPYFKFLHLYFQFLCLSFCFLMVILMLSWVGAHDFFLLYAISF